VDEDAPVDKIIEELPEFEADEVVPEVETVETLLD